MTHGLATVPESPSASNLEDARHLAPMITDLSLSSATNQAPNTTEADPKRGSKRKPKAPLKAPAIVPACQQYVGNPDLWKAPDVWEYSASEPEVSPIEEAAVSMGSEDISQLALDMASMQREANRLLGASPQTILQRLKEKWGDQNVHVALETGTESMQGDVDATVDQALMYKELEMERKRWMLSALNHMEAATQPNTVISKPKVKPKVQKILSLFDSQGTSSQQSYPSDLTLTSFTKRPPHTSRFPTRVSPSTISPQSPYLIGGTPTSTP